MVVYSCSSNTIIQLKKEDCHEKVFCKKDRWSEFQMDDVSDRYMVDIYRLWCYGVLSSDISIRDEGFPYKLRLIYRNLAPTDGFRKPSAWAYRFKSFRNIYRSHRRFHNPLLHLLEQKTGHRKFMVTRRPENLRPLPFFNLNI